MKVKTTHFRCRQDDRGLHRYNSDDILSEEIFDNSNRPIHCFSVLVQDKIGVMVYLVETKIVDNELVVTLFGDKKDESGGEVIPLKGYIDLLKTHQKKVL